MKKALVILLALTMVMSMFAMLPLGASAAEEDLAVGAVAADYKPEGTAINTAEEFAAMAADGKYYLAADITVSETYANDFTGTFDGNGKTVTTSTALFAALDGTVKNLTIVGEIDYKTATTEFKAEGYTGALANIIGNTAAASVINVCNKTNIYASAGGAGGVIGMVANDEIFEIVFEKVVNYGDVVSTAGKNNGGIAAVLDGDDEGAEFYVQFIDCANYGKVDAVGNVGGIVGNDNASTKFVNCCNAGDVTSSNHAAGIVAQLAHAVPFAFERCVNDGNITVTAGSAAGGGIIATTADDSDGIGVNNVKLVDCVNNGDVSGSGNKSATGGMIGNAGCFVGSLDSYDTPISLVRCINNGDITSTHTSNSYPGGMVGIVFNKTYHCYLDIYYCGNTGNITGGKYAGGMIARIDTNAGAAAQCRSGANVVGCFNVGDVYGGTYAAGLIAYTAMSGPATIAHNYVAGDIKSGTVVTPIENGGTVSEDTIYSIESNTHDTLYFIAPTSGKVTLSSDDVVTVTATSSKKFLPLADGNKNIATGTKLELNTIYSYTDKKGDVWGFYALKNGTVTITEPDGGGKPTVVIDGTEIYVMPLPSDNDKTITNVKTFTTPITNACALVWNRMNCRDLSTNYVLEGTADGMIAVQGFGCIWFALDIIVENDDNTFTAEELADGTLAHKLNEEIGETVFYQNLDPELFEVDAYPTIDKTHAKVVEIGGDYTNETFEQNADCTPATGDATVYVVVALAVSTVALAGFMVAKKVKEN